jgi:SAM-dependent methyltransferase
MAKRDQAQFRELWQLKVDSGEILKAYRAGANKRVDKALQIVTSGERLLDIGCGTGIFASEAHSQGRFAEVYGIDISDIAVDIARQQGVNAQVINLSSDTLPYPDDFFDTITILSALQYIYQPQIALAECYRTLKQNGTLLLTAPNMRSVGKLYKLMIKGYFPNSSGDVVGHDGGAINYFCFRNLVTLLTKTGFNIDFACGIFCRPMIMHKVTDKGLLGVLKREFFSGEVFVKSTKVATIRNPGRLTGFNVID